jgi:hypothetical protein
MISHSSGSCFIPKLQTGQLQVQAPSAEMSAKYKNPCVSLWPSTIQSLKTDNAIRDIDLPSPLQNFLKSFIGTRKSGFLFRTESGRPLGQRNALRDSLNPILTELKIKQNGKAFHAFRRFRTSHLRRNRVPWDLEKFWIGHANRDVTDKYASQLKDDVEWRKEVAEKTGLGFNLPAVSTVPVGQPEVIQTEEEKAA